MFHDLDQAEDCARQSDPNGWESTRPPIHIPWRRFQPPAFFGLKYLELHHGPELLEIGTIHGQSPAPCAGTDLAIVSRSASSEMMLFLRALVAYLMNVFNSGRRIDYFLEEHTLQLL